MKEETYVYALDISLSNTGISIFTNNGNLVEYSSISTTKEKDLRRKLVIIANEYKKYMKAYPPSKIIMEQGFTKFNLSTQAIFRCVGVTNYIFNEYEQVTIPATTIKKSMTGKGTAKKDEVRDAVLKVYPNCKFDDFDQSDSVAIGIVYFKREGIIE